MYIFIVDIILYIFVTCREDLQMWVKEYTVTGVAPGEHPDKVKQQVDLVKSQQNGILTKLQNDAESLEQELAACRFCCCFNANKYFSIGNDNKIIRKKQTLYRHPYLL